MDMPEQMPQVLVVGAGAVGCYIAARMIERGIDIAVLTEPRRAEQIVCRSLIVQSVAGSFRKSVHAITADEIKVPFDAVIFATRACAFERALRQAAPAIDAHTVVLSLTDGGPHSEAIRAATPATVVLDAVFEGRLLIDADGVIRHRGPDARIAIGALGHDDRAATTLAALLTGRGLITTAVDDIAARIAVKAAFEVSVIATTIVTGLPLRDALRTRKGDKLFRELLRTAPFLVPEGMEVPLSQIERYRDRWFWESEPIALPPLVTDGGTAGREAHFLLPNFIERARRHGLRVPLLRVIAETGTVPSDFVAFPPMTLEDPAMIPDAS